MSQPTEKRRIASIELLRILSMLMVVTLHYISKTGALALPGEEMTPVRYMGGFLESFCIVAVNVYVLISGYFLSAVPFKVSRGVRLLAQVLFYTLLIPPVLRAAGLPIYGQGVWKAAAYFLPVSTEHYWFVSAYILMFVFSPLLNAAVEKLQRKALRTVLLLLLFFTCLLKSISPVQLVTDRMGYDFGWFLVLYLLAAYIRKYGLRRLEDPKRAAFVYIGSSLGVYGLHICLHMVNEKTGALSYYATVPFHYNSLLCLTGALGFFSLFRCLRLRENGFAAAFSRAVAPHAFGVYLIHEQIDIRDRWVIWMQTLTGNVQQESPLRFLLQALVTAVIVFTCCALIDCVRSRLFKAVSHCLRGSRIAGALREADTLFARQNGDFQHAEKT